MIVLLADSRPLFERPGATGIVPLPERDNDTGPRVAVYVGAASGDAPEYYAIFLSTMQGSGYDTCHMISSEYHEIDRDHLLQADLIVLGGGDVARGIRRMRDTELFDDLRRSPSRGAALIGVSAGAIHLGVVGCTPEGSSPGLGLVPYVVDAHAEEDGWSRLRACVEGLSSPLPGLGIPWGGGVAIESDGTLIPFGKPVAHFESHEGALTELLLFPRELD